MTSKPRRRFYKTVATEEEKEGVALLLDGKPVRTPAGQPFRIAGRNLAQAIAAEWEAQGERIRPETMPLTQLAFTAQDRMHGETKAIRDTLIRFAETDLLCYRADAPAELARRQIAHWQPMLDWAALALDAPLRVSTGIVPIDQPADSLSALAKRLEALDPNRLAALASVTAASGSLILALALIEGTIEAEAAVVAAQLDEAYQREQWGEDDEATTRLVALAEEIRAAARFLALL
ncbi:MAG: ATPase [Rhodospirillales bacterium]|nr:ATPase [Rhodospirillales bacterium]